MNTTYRTARGLFGSLALIALAACSSSQNTPTTTQQAQTNVAPQPQATASPSPTSSPVPVVFQNVTATSGIPQNLQATGLISYDFTGDHLPDLIFNQPSATVGQPDALRFFANLGGFQFKEIPLVGETTIIPQNSIIKIIPGFYRHGHLGGFAITYSLATMAVQMSFFELAYDAKAGTMTISTVPGQAPFMTTGAPSAVQVADLNRDGALDIVIGQHYKYPNATSNDLSVYEAYPPMILYGKKDPKTGYTRYGPQTLLTDPTLAADQKFAAAPTFEISICDLAGDGKDALILPGYGRRWNKLFTKSSDGTFKDVGFDMNFAGDSDDLDNFRGNANSFTAVCSDFDRDGKMDVFQGSITHLWAGPTSDLSMMLWSEWPKPFQQSSDFPRPLSFQNQGDLSASAGDFDNDGLNDLLVDNSDYPPETALAIWQNAGGRQFSDATPGVSDRFINPKGGHFVDLNLDGMLDIASNSSAMRGNYTPYSRIYQNVLENSNGWLNLELKSEDADVTEFPIGTKITVQAGGKTLIEELTGGFGNEYQALGPVHVGLGKLADTYQRVPVTIRWPNGITKTLTLTSGTNYAITLKGGLTHASIIETP